MPSSSCDGRIVVFTDGTVDVNDATKSQVGAAAAVGLWILTPTILEGVGILSRRVERQGVTNNQMELLGFQLALEIVGSLRRPRLEIWSDSQWAINAIFNSSWNITQNKEMVALIRQHIRSSGMQVTASFIRAHRKLFLNEMANSLAQAALKWETRDCFTPAMKADYRCLTCRHCPCEYNKTYGPGLLPGVRASDLAVCPKFEDYLIDERRKTAPAANQGRNA